MRSLKSVANTRTIYVSMYEYDLHHKFFFYYEAPNNLRMGTHDP